MLAAILTDFIDRTDAGVVERRRRLSLSYEPRLGWRVRVGSGRKHFDGDSPIEHRVLAEVHLTHAAGSKLAHDAIAADGFGSHTVRGRRSVG